MFDFLQKIDQRVYERYLTLERNIKSGANSFYDAYLDLQEQFVRFVLVEMGLDATARETCGALLKREDAIAVFQNLGVDTYTYDKMGDYALKVNAHKHKGEKRIQVDTILNYMRIFYEVSTCYAKHANIAFGEFDADYILSIFGIFEKENAALQTQLEAVKSELAELAQQKRLREEDMAIYRAIIQRTELGTMSFEEQNRELREQLLKLKDIQLTAMEQKLDQALEMLLSLQNSVVENRAISYAVGDTICGSDRFKAYVEKAKEDINNAE